MASNVLLDLLNTLCSGNITSPSNTPELSENAKRMIDLAIQNAWADSTLGNLGISAVFAASYAGSLSASTVEGKLAAVWAWHIVNNFRYNGGIRLNYVLKGVENLAPDGLPPRPPVTDNLLQLLHDHLDLSDPFDSCVFSAATTGLWGQCRMGELLSKTEHSWNPELIPADASPPEHKDKTQKRGFLIHRQTARSDRPCLSLG
ncbi:hypothetical protein B0H17DRAFT_1129329 [Mycena rosella]|uniref:Uncharacterized protein n=1 Tax=Mycena rosella TaxID=1033263 RepID=A0AAD7GPJ4_MYCRO|nr:hypothetical protein B0H17DRAFT_1129329 [Mycena rosella]